MRRRSILHFSAHIPRLLAVGKALRSLIPGSCLHCFKVYLAADVGFLFIRCLIRIKTRAVILYRDPADVSFPDIGINSHGESQAQQQKQ